MSWSSSWRHSSRTLVLQLRTPPAPLPAPQRSLRTAAATPKAAGRASSSPALVPPHSPRAASKPRCYQCSPLVSAKGKERARPMVQWYFGSSTASRPLTAASRSPSTGSRPLSFASRSLSIPFRPFSTTSFSGQAASIASPYANDQIPSPPSSSREGLAGLGTTQLSPDILLRCTIFDAAGTATSSSGVFKKSKLCSDHGLEPRDLRKIDSRVPNLVPTILARKDGILVNILHIRAMIKADTVLLFDSYGSSDTQLHSAFVYNLQFNLRQTASSLPYEFRALESILVSVLDALRIELDLIRSWAGRILEGLDEDVDREKLRALLQVSRKLNSFLSRSRGVKGAVTEVLDDDEDMALMYLTDSKGGRARTELSKMDELELLLESFDKQVEEVVAETEQIHNDMSNTQEVVELILDNNRNKLLALDLRTSIATLGISAGTLWAGLFGMNLTSHFEEHQYAFFVSSGVAFLTAFLVAAFGLRQLRRLRRVGLQLREPFGVTGRSPARRSKYGSERYGGGQGERKRRWWFPFGLAPSAARPDPAPAPSTLPLSGYGSSYASPFGVHGPNVQGGVGLNGASRFGSPFLRVDEKYQQALAQHMSEAEDDPRHPFPTGPTTRLSSSSQDALAPHERRGPLYANSGTGAGVGIDVGAEAFDQQSNGPMAATRGTGDDGGVGLGSKWEARKRRKP